MQVCKYGSMQRELKEDKEIFNSLRMRNIRSSKAHSSMETVYIADFKVTAWDSSARHILSEFINDELLTLLTTDEPNSTR